MVRVPAEHDGSAFAVRIRFSEAVETKAKDAGVQVSGGTLTRAVRLKKRKDLWELRLAPSGQGAVTVTLPAGAARTADGRTLSDAATVTVSGPVALSVADASAREGAGATMDFAVTLSRAASGKVTVRYATRNGTAKKGKDYGKAKGTLAFAAGETSKTVSVAILDDAHDEGAETFRLVLYQAKGAAIADGEAVGTIENADPLQQDWLARFGRAAAADAVAAVTARLETPRDAGSHLTLAGQRVDLTGTDGGADRLSWSGEPAGEYRSRTMSGRELLLGTSFRAVLGGGAGAQWTSWGQGASVSAFSSTGPSLSLSGETATGSLGMDWEHGRLLTGLAMTHSLGEGTAQGSGRTYAMGSSVTTALPYARLALSERLSAWGLAGTGSGRLTLDLDGGAPERTQRGPCDDAGGGGHAGRARDAGAKRAGSRWRSRRTRSGCGRSRRRSRRRRRATSRARGPRRAGCGRCSTARGPSRSRTGGRSAPRWSSGCATTGATRRPGRARSSAPASATRTRRGASTWRSASTVSRGMPTTATPNGACRGRCGWCRAPPGAACPRRSRRRTAWTRAARSVCGRCRTRTRWPRTTNAALSSRLDTEIGYGLGGPAGLGTLTPYAGLGLAGDDARTWRAGARWSIAPDVSLNLEGTLSESANDDAPEHGVMLRSAVRW